MSNIVRFVIYTWEDENGTVPSLSSLSWLQRGVDKLPVCPCARGLTAHRLVPVIHLSAWKSRMSRVANSSRQVDAASKRTWYSRMSDIINRWITGNGWHFIANMAYHVSIIRLLASCHIRRWWSWWRYYSQQQKKWLFFKETCRCFQCFLWWPKAVFTGNVRPPPTVIVGNKTGISSQTTMSS